MSENQYKFPAKTVIKDGEAINFQKLSSDFPNQLTYFYKKSAGYQEHYPSVYSIELKGEGFYKSYDVTADQYFENLGLINYDQFSLYNYISSLRNRGYYLSIKGKKGKDGDKDIKGLAAMVGMRTNTLTEHIDHLSDCLLLHRVRRLDLHGCPNEYVIHTPFTTNQLHKQGKHSLIVQRIAKQYSKNQRLMSVTKSTSANGKNFGYLNRKETEERFQMNYAWIKESFGNSHHFFTDFALRFFKDNLGLLRNKKGEFDFEYRSELNRAMTLWGIAANSARERCYIAANKFRVIYCPSEEELCT